MQSYLFPNYARKPFEISSGKECYVTDSNGKTYLDFTSGIGVMNLGYSQTSLDEVLVNQAEKIWHSPNLYLSDLQEKLAEKLSYADEYLGFFCNSGAEANEAAIKLARKATGKSKIISFKNSFHGRTYGSMSATGQEEVHQGFAPLVPDFSYLTYNDSQIKEAITNQTAAVILELVQGEGGVTVAKKDWIAELVKLCNELDVLIIVDEVQTGIGRTGTLYAFEQFDFEPDIFTLAKGLGNGFPIGAMFGKKELAASFGPGSHGSTFGGNKLAMAVGNQVLDLISPILNTISAKSELLFKELNKIQSDKIVEIRGLGLMVGIELKADVPVADILTKLEQKGLLALKAGSNTLRLLPPLVISEEEIIVGTNKIAEVLTK